MINNNSNNTLRNYFILILISVIMFVLDVAFGSVTIPVSEIFSGIFSEEKSNYAVIINEFRLPKAFTAVFTGIALSLSGLLMQTYFRNALAGPFVLGISSGASLGVAIFVMAGSFISFSVVALTSSLSIVVAAIIGSVLVLMLIVLFSTKLRDSVSLLIIGIMVAAFSSSIVAVIQFFTSAELLQSYIFWTMGSLSSVRGTALLIYFVIILIGVLGALFLIKPLNAFLIGESEARTLGVNTESFKWKVIFITALLSGVATAFCGPIAFIGIAIPHLARRMFNAYTHEKLIGYTIFSGVIFMLMSDIISQLPGSEKVIPINAVTSLLGAPVVIWVVLKSKKARSF